MTEASQSISYRRRWAIAGAVLLALYAGSLMVGKTPPPVYSSSQWSESPPAAVTRLLRNQSFGSCKYIQSIYISQGQYAVRCSIDLKTWDSHTVDLNSGLVH